MQQTKIEKVKGDWQEVLDDCRFTVGKEPLGKEPSVGFKKRVLLAEHSPIRDISFKWTWRQAPHWVLVHWVRHKFEKFVRTQREDRAGIPRDKLPQTEPQDFRGEANVQHLIDTMRKRLCYQASKETRELAEDLKYAIHKIEPEIADVLVPNCIYRCGCPEMDSCNFIDGLQDVMMDVNFFDIQERYDAYNAKLYKRLKLRIED